jgi:hypothetical protein
MITPEEIAASCNRLKAAIKPPLEPVGLETRNVPTSLPKLPMDLFAIVDAYGSGFFELDGAVFLSVLNPYEEQYSRRLNEKLDTIRRLKDSEGEDYVPYPIFPEPDGLLLWGFGQDRKHFFWRTVGPPESWKVIALYDLEIFTGFEMPMIRFMEQLLCGELDCAFIGGVDVPENKLNPTALQFVPRVMP